MALFSISVRNGKTEELAAFLQTVVTDAGLARASSPPVRITLRDYSIEVAFINNDIHFPPKNALQMLASAQRLKNQPTVN